MPSTPADDSASHDGPDLGSRQTSRSAESRRIPPLGLLLGFGPVALLPILAVASTALPPIWAANTIILADRIAAAILIFIGGARRGLSFFSRTSERPSSVFAALCYFGFGFGALLISIPFALGLLIVGYGVAGIVDRRAARSGEAPRYFSHLRPLQAVVAIAGLAGLLARALAI